MDFNIFDNDELNKKFNEKMLHFDIDDRKEMLDTINSFPHPICFNGFNTDDIYDICIHYLNIIDSDCYFQDSLIDLKVFNFLSAYAWEHRGE